MEVTEGMSAVSPTRSGRESLLARMTRIIDAFDDPNADLSLDRIARRAGLPRSSTHRIIVEMIELDWLTRWGRNFRLGPRAVGAIGPQAAHARIRVGAGGILQELFLRTGMVIHLGVLDGGQEYFLDKIGGPYAQVLRSRVGGRFPAHRGAGGRSMLALLSPEEVDDVVGPVLARPGADPRWTMPTLHAELARIRDRKGIAFETVATGVGAERQTIGSVGCAVRSRDGAAVSLSVAGDAGSLRPATLVPVLRAAAAALAKAV